MTDVNFQQIAINTFQTIIDRATRYRAGENIDSSSFHTSEGICDNIYRCMQQDAKEYHPQINNVKNNVIRRLASYSGEYHYPVKSATAGRTAEYEWDGNRNKWDGDYGLNRLNQAAELLEYVKTNWNPNLTNALSPAQQLGFEIGSHVLCTADNKYYTLSHDDETRDPYFVPFGNVANVGNDGRRCIHLDNIKAVDFDKEKLPVSAYIRSIRKNISKTDALQKRMDALQKEMNELKMQRMAHDLGLKHHHSLKFV